MVEVIYMKYMKPGTYSHISLIYHTYACKHIYNKENMITIDASNIAKSFKKVIV